MRRCSTLATLAQAVSRRPRLAVLEQHCQALRLEEEELRSLAQLAFEEKDFVFQAECEERLRSFWRQQAKGLLEQMALPKQDVFLELQASEGGTDAMNWPFGTRF